MMFLIPFNSYTLMFCLVIVEGLMQPFADLLHILICSAGCFCFHVHVPSKNEQIFWQFWEAFLGGSWWRGWKGFESNGCKHKMYENMVLVLSCTKDKA